MRDGQWWRDVDPSMWSWASSTDDAARDRTAALLAAMDELATRAPAADVQKLRAQLLDVGYLDPIDPDTLQDTLTRLIDKDLVVAFRDYGTEVGGIDELAHRHERWTLTRKGRVAVNHVRDGVADALRKLQLPRRLLDAIARTLQQLLEQYKAGETAAGSMDVTFNDVETRIEDLRTMTQDFHAAVAVLLRSDVTQDQLFRGNRDRILEGLQQVALRYEIELKRVETILGQLEEIGYEHLAQAAVTSAGLLDAGDEPSWITSRARLLDALAGWFEPDGGVRGVLSASTSAIDTLLSAVQRRHAAQERGSDLTADLLQMARSLHAQPDDAAARQVFAAAFGLWPSVHARGDQLDVRTTATAAAAGQVLAETVSPRANQRSGNSRGRPPLIADVSDARAEVLAAATEAAHRVRRIAAELTTDGPTPLHRMTGLSDEAAGVLLDTVAQAVAKLRGSGTTETVVSLPAAGVNLRVIRHPDAPYQMWEIGRGRLTGPAVTVDITPAGTEAVGGDVDAAVSLRQQVRA